MPSDNNLHKAAHKGDIDECKIYIEAPEGSDDRIDVNEPGASDRRALHRSAGGGHLELSIYFIEKGAIVDQADKSGRTPLHWAVISGNTEIVKMLLSKGADVCAISESKCNALHFAVEKGSSEIVRVLMTHAGSVSEEKKTELTMAKNSDDKVPWDIAAASKNSSVCQALKDLGDVNGASSSCVIC